MAQTLPQGFTIWFTGLSGAGKSTLADALVAELVDHRGLAVEVWDGDIVRTHLSKGLGFSKEDRDINIRRIGFVCSKLTQYGVINIAAAISPYRAVRDEAVRVVLVRGAGEHFSSGHDLGTPEQLADWDALRAERQARHAHRSRRGGTSW